jgi:hypothetical protein
VGPDTRREDMFGVSERKLALRSVHEALLTRDAMQAWTHHQKNLDVRVKNAEEQLVDHETRIGALEKGGLPTPIPLPPMRDPESSYHGFDAELRDLREDIRSKVKDTHHPLSEASALRLIRSEAARMKAATELGTWRRIKLFFTTTGGKMIDRGITVIIAAAVGYLAHYLGKH